MGRIGDMSDMGNAARIYRYPSEKPSAEEMEYLRDVRLPNSRPRRVREAVMDTMPRLSREIRDRMRARNLSPEDVARTAKVRKADVQTLMDGRPASLRVVDGILGSLELSTPVYPPEVMRFGS